MSTRPARDDHTAMQDVVRAFEYAVEHRRQVEAKPPRVIAISRQVGSGGRRIAQALAGWLKWRVWDREILDVLAGQSHRGYQARMFEALDERTQSDIEAVILSLFGEMDKHVYFYLLPRAILTIAQHDAIILGRGAHLILPRSLRVSVEASHDIRVANLVRWEGLSEEAAESWIRRTDAEREAFSEELLRRLIAVRPDWSKQPEYDLAVNTDKFSVEEAAAIVLTAATKEFGLLPAEIHLQP